MRGPGRIRAAANSTVPASQAAAPRRATTVLRARAPASAVAAASAALEATRRRVGVLEHAEQVAQLDLESEQARFQASRSTNFDVLRRQQALTDVRERLLRARIDNAEAAAILDAIDDDILPRHGLALRGSITEGR